MSGPCLLSSSCTVIVYDRNCSTAAVFHPGNHWDDTALIKTIQELKPIMDGFALTFPKKKLRFEGS